MILHLLHLCSPVPSAARADSGFTVYQNAWHLLGLSKTAKPIPRRFWIWCVNTNGYLPGYIISSWERHPTLNFSNSHYSTEQISGNGDWLILGSYNLINEERKIKSTRELYIHSLADKNNADVILDKINGTVPFESVYFGDEIAMVSWNSFFKLQAPRDLSLLEKK